MKKTQKGVTLIEVIVAITVFSIISLALFSTVIAMKKIITRQEEYTKLEMICYDIDAYWKKYGDDWDEYYFASSSDVGYLSADFNVVSKSEEAEYLIRYNTENEDVLTISIYSKDEKTIYVENVRCMREESNETQ